MNIKANITMKQKRVLDFIREHVRGEGVPPTVREIGSHFGYSSPGTVQDYLRVLKEKGLINIRKKYYRGIELLVPACSIPLLGSIRAGAPEEAIEDVEDWIDVSGLFPREDGLFALRVKGDSMMGCGIMEGDIVVVRKQVTAENNDIVVALMDDEATVKRLKRNGEVWLQPENPLYEPIKSKEFSVMGKVVGVIRNY